VVNLKNKILIFSGLYPLNKESYGGVFIRKRLEQLIDENINFDIFSIKNVDTFFVALLKKILNKNILNDKNDSIKYENYDWNFIVSNKSIIDYIFKDIYFNKVFKIIERRIDINEYNIISVHWAYPEGLIAYKIKEKYGIPYTITLHGSDIHTNPFRNKKIKKYTLEVLENADKCIFVSDALRKKAIELGYSNKNSIVIPNGFDPDIFFYESKELKKKDLSFKSSKLVGFVGNLIDVKNVLILTEIFEKIKKEYSDVDFVIVGKGNLKSDLKKQFEEKNIKVRFTGRLEQKEVAEYMKAMDVMVLPSKNEGFGSVILEAQACGTYTVGSKIGGIPEAIGNVGETFELDENFVDNISNSIINKLENGYDIDKILTRIKSFTWEKIVKQEIALFNKIISK
jgi:glycosyltransferase involved in cell wall biosynthesis